MKSAFVITQTTYPCPNLLSYSAVRSVYTPQERLLQLFESIESVYSLCPRAKVIVLENGMVDIAAEIPPGVEYKYFGNKKLVRWAADSQFKGLGEASLLLLFLWNVGRKFDSDLVFKLSGRYRLSKGFSQSNFCCSKFSFLFYQEAVSTRLYAVPKTLVKKWFLALFCSVPGLLRGHSIEHLLPKFLRADDVHVVSRLCVEGEVGVCGTTIRE